MINISQQELVQLLRDVKGAKPATILAITIPAMRKTGNPYVDKVTKMQTSNVFINFNYANNVNTARFRNDEETGFVAKPRHWGQRIAGTPLVEHKGNYYLECRFMKASTPIYMIDGQPTQKSVLEPWLQESTSNAEHQGLTEETEIIVRDFKLINVKEIKLDKVHYNVI